MLLPGSLNFLKNQRPDIEKYATPITFQTIVGMVAQKIANSSLESPVCWSVSSLLIPDAYLRFFNAMVQKYGSRRCYFSHLAQFGLNQLPRFLTLLNSRKDPKWKTYYQSRGLQLVKRNFIPFPADWEGFRHCATAAGVSICFLFVFLMELEMTGQLGPEEDGNSFISRLCRMIFFRRYSRVVRKLHRDGKRLKRKSRHRYNAGIPDQCRKLAVEFN